MGFELGNLKALVDALLLEFRPRPLKLMPCQIACQQTDCLRCRPPAARVSGIVEESPGNLEYEVALFREASRDEEVSSNEVPVDQAVAIGTKLQLRATINSQQSGATIMNI